VEERRVGIESSEFVGAVQRMRSAYKTELDAAMTAVGVTFSMTIRQEVTHIATFPASLRTI